MIRMAIYKKIVGVNWRCLYRFFKKTCRMHALKLLVGKIPLLKKNCRNNYIRQTNHKDYKEDMKKQNET